MDNETVFTKTAKGLKEASGKTSLLSRDLRNILKEIDGKANVAQLQGKVGKVSGDKLRAALTTLTAEDYIREFAQSTSGANTIALDFSTIARPGKLNKPPQSQLRRIDDVLRKVPEARNKTDTAAPPDTVLRAKIDMEEWTRLQAEEQARRDALVKANKDADERRRREAEERIRKELEEWAGLQNSEQTSGEEESIRLAAEEQARADARAKTQRVAEAQARQEAEERSRREAEEQARHLAEEQSRKAVEEKAEAKARLEAEAAAAAQAKKVAEERIRHEAEERRRKEAEEKARLEEKSKARREAEEHARKEAEERARLEAEARVTREAEERARREAEDKARREAEQQARSEAEERARKEAEQRARLEAEATAKREAEERTRREAEERSRREAEEQARREAEEQANRDVEIESRRMLEAQARIRREREAQAQREAEEARRQLEIHELQVAEAKSRLEAERVAEESRCEIEALEQAAAEEQARREAEEKSKRETEAQAEAKKAAEHHAKREAQERKRKEAVEDARRKAVRARGEAQNTIQRQTAPREKEEALAWVRREAEERDRKAAEAEGRLHSMDRVEHVEQEPELEPDDEQNYEQYADRYHPEPRVEQPGKGGSKSYIKPGKWVKSGMLGLVCLLILGIGLIHVIAFDGQIARFEKAASEQLEQPVKIEQVHLSLLPQPHWRLEGVSIGSDGQIKAPTVKTITGLDSLFDDKAVFESIEIDSPVFSDAALGWLLFAKPQGRKFMVDHINVTNAKLNSQTIGLAAFDARADIGEDGAWKKITIDTTDKKTHVDLQPQGDAVQVELAAESFTVPFGSALMLEQFTATAVARRNELIVSQFRGSILGGALRGTAKLKWDAGWSLAGELTATHMEPAQLAPAVIQGGRLEGKASYAMEAKDADQLFAAPRIEGSFTVRDGTLLGVDLAGLIRSGKPVGKTLFSEVAGTGAYENGKVQLRKLTLGAGLLSAKGSLDVDSNKNLNGRFSVEFKSPSAQTRGNFGMAGTLKDPQFGR
jgi:hypothetical protein